MIEREPFPALSAAFCSHCEWWVVSASGDPGSGGA